MNNDVLGHSQPYIDFLGARMHAKVPPGNPTHVKVPSVEPVHEVSSWWLRTV